MYPRTVSDAPLISLIVPAWNEEHYLPHLLDSVDRARARFPGGDGAIEVVVGDNASTDRTAEIAQSRGCRVVLVENRVIGAARNGGARAARGSILAFIDADSRIHEDTFAVVARTLASPDVIAGTTGLVFARWSPGIAATYAMALPVAWLTGLDAGVVFCRRADFFAIGGYSEERLFAEDVQLLLDLRRLGRGRGQRLARARGAKAVTSTRKFDRHGDWHTFRMLLQAAPHWLRSRARRERAIRTVARRYWYEERFNPPSPPADGSRAQPPAR